MIWKLFLQFDNQDKIGNRILVFFSDKGAEIMEKAKEWHMDGTFKNCPKIFKQLLTLHYHKWSNERGIYVTADEIKRHLYSCIFRIKQEEGASRLSLVILHPIPNFFI